MSTLNPQVGDVVKYGPKPDQWGRVVQKGYSSGCLYVRRKNKLLKVKSEIVQVIKKDDFEALRGAIKSDVAFTVGTVA